MQGFLGEIIADSELSKVPSPLKPSYELSSTSTAYMRPLNQQRPEWTMRVSLPVTVTRGWPRPGTVLSEHREGTDVVS